MGYRQDRPPSRVPRFATLEPGLSALEQLATCDPAVWMMLSTAARGDDAEATRLLNERLRATGTTVRVRRVARGWVLVAAGAPEMAATSLLSLAELISADGWRRVKTCEKTSCTTMFIDRTNGNSSRFCRSHRRVFARKSSAGQ
ncbi:CGNR zinc finger domain-containing protein [Nocardia colli]|uniref:CGNR zinc finger domain-containing protein n=1 Tax=Nocardia colli TaxID=2545717 RepID=UPI0035E22F6B